MREQANRRATAQAQNRQVDIGFLRDNYTITLAGRLLV